ncbi:MAG TPA: DNA repair protein RecO [Candidatus Humimicrobiaceae bacterium]|nr:DNA repair protein RecO [Candidatus Humimicrobiaceae bacterium]
MFVHYRTQGLILKKEDRGDADLLFTIYTRDFGKLKILGKAIRKISSKLRAGAEIFYLSEIEFIQGKTYKTLTDAILIEKFANIKTDLKRLKIAYKISGILDNLVKDPESDEKIWRLLKETFRKLNKLETTEVKLEILYYYFFWNLVSFLGYQPELWTDSICGRQIDADLAKILKIIIKNDWQVLLKLKITPVHLRLLKNISQWYNKEVCVID